MVPEDRLEEAKRLLEEIEPADEQPEDPDE